MLQPHIHLMIPQFKSRNSRIALKLVNLSLCSWRLLICAKKKKSANYGTQKYIITFT